MARTTASFRALREMCGVTQQQVADRLGVRVVTIKRWERGDSPVPEDAMALIMSAMAEHDAGVADDLARILASAEPGAEICMPYYRSQAQADLDCDPGETAGPYNFLNAITRSTAERLVAMGYRVSFSYPDEERIYDGEI